MSPSWPSLFQAWRHAVIAALPMLRKPDVVRTRPSYAKDVAPEKITTKQPKTSGRWFGRILGGK